MASKHKRKMVADDFSIEPQQDSSWTLAITVIGVTLLLSFGFVYYYFGPTLTELTGDAPDPTTSEELIALSIGGESFMIPANFTRFPRARRGGNRDEVSLHALLPKLGPYTVENQSIFDRNDASSPVIFFDISTYQTALSEKQRFERIYLENVVDKQGRQGPYGFTVFQFSETSGYRDEDLFVYGKNTASPVIIRCYKNTDIIPSPHCRRDFRINENLLLSYRYKRPWLAQWRAIDQALQNFVRALHIPTPVPKPAPPGAS